MSRSFAVRGLGFLCGVLVAVAACGGGQGPAATPPMPSTVQTGVAPAGAPATAVAPAAAAFTLQPSKVQLTSDVYDVFMTHEGRRMRVGSSIISVLKDGPNYRMLDQSSAVALGVEGTSASVFSVATGSGVSSISQGTWQGQPFESAVHVAKGRVTGTLVTPDELGGMRTVKVDAAAPEFLILDEEVLMALLPTVDLAEGMKAEFPVLDYVTGNIRPLRITVGKPETVTVPAGKFEAFRVRAHSRHTGVLHVTVASPRRVVKVVYEGIVELRLAK